MATWPFLNKNTHCIFHSRSAIEMSGGDSLGSENGGGGKVKTARK